MWTAPCHETGWERETARGMRNVLLMCEQGTGDRLTILSSPEELNCDGTQILRLRMKIFTGILYVCGCILSTWFKPRKLWPFSLLFKKSLVNLVNARLSLKAFPQFKCLKDSETGKRILTRKYQFWGELKILLCSECSCLGSGGHKK